MEIVGGVMAGQGMKHGIGRVVSKWPPKIRVSKKDKERLSRILSSMSKKNGEARKARQANGVNGTNGAAHAVAHVEHPESAPLPTLTRLLTDQHLAFFKRLANDERLPKDIRSEAFTHFLGE